MNSKGCEGALRSRKWPTNAKNHDYYLKIWMQPDKPRVVEGRKQGWRAVGKSEGLCPLYPEYQSFSVLPGWTRTPRARAYTWQIMAWAMSKHGCMNTSVQEPPLDYSFRNIQVIQGQPTDNSTPLTMAAGWVRSPREKSALYLKASRDSSCMLAYFFVVFFLGGVEEREVGVEVFGLLKN